MGAGQLETENEDNEEAMTLRRMSQNPILDTDSYKPSHWRMLPPDMTGAAYYYESRGGAFPTAGLIGLSYLADEYLTVPITRGMMEEAEELMAAHFNSRRMFNSKGWGHVVDDLGGRLPVEIRALPEGLSAPTHNVLFTVRNTHPSPLTAWVPGYVETLLSLVWSPSTTYTKSREVKKVIARALAETGDPGDVDSTPWRYHDFGMRGSHSYESGAVNGFAHLVNFHGTDTLSAIRFAKAYYGETGMPANSIAASEHSTMMASKTESEAYRRILDAYGQEPFVAIVSDTYNLYDAVDKIIGGALKDRVEDMPGTLVVRPDSGDPPVVVRQVIEHLASAFGYRTNSKGYSVLSDRVRVIQGDGVNLDSIKEVYAALSERRISAANISYGCGGWLHSSHTRDTQRFAMKECEVTVGGEVRPVRKTPVTDAGKWSKAGVYMVVRNPDTGVIESYPEGRFPASENLLRPVYRDGQLLERPTLAQLRERAALTQEELATA
jgi:nicotinamide phosphoribosyltransferase